MNLGDNFQDNIISGSKYRRSKTDPGVASRWRDGVISPLFRSDTGLSLEIFQSRFAVTLLLVCIVFGLLSVRLFNLQVIEGKQKFFLSEGNRIRIQRLRPERGIIFDTTGQVLARNAPGFKVGVDVSKVTESNLDNVKRDLAVILDMSEEEINRKIEERLAQGINEVTIKSGIDRNLVFVIETKLNELPGVFIEVAPVREYPYGEMLAHILGYTGEISQAELEAAPSAIFTLGDRVGKIGLEKVYDIYLHGKSGKRLLETDATGKNLREIARQDAISGNALHLNIDINLQRIAYESLKKTIETNQATGGVAIVEKVDTGELLALAVLPAFDSNKFSKTLTLEEYTELLTDSRRPMFNRAISGLYPPGSTFKMITASAALEEGVVKPSTKIEEVQTISVGSYAFSNWTLAWGVPTHGPLNIVQAIAYSSDIYFYEVGGGYGSQPGLGVEKLASWAETFGLGEKTGIDLVGEEGGVVPDEDYKRRTKNEPWYLGDSYHMAIGQGDVLSTPIQIANVTVAVANGGKLLRPFLAKNIRDLKGNVVASFEPRVIREDFVSKEILQLVRQGMSEAVEYGTAVALRDFKVKIAGKTGTSETGIEGKNHAWFTSFAPYDDPEIVVTVFVEYGGAGSVVALPVAKDIMEEYFK